MTDVVIAGYGPAGAAAAIAAHDAGRSVLILESAERAEETPTTAAGSCSTYQKTPPSLTWTRCASAAPTAGCSRPTRPACTNWTAGCARWAGPPHRSSRRLPAASPFPSWPHLQAGRRIRYRTVAAAPGAAGGTVGPAGRRRADPRYRGALPPGRRAPDARCRRFCHRGGGREDRGASHRLTANRGFRHC